MADKADKSDLESKTWDEFVFPALRPYVREIGGALLLLLAVLCLLMLLGLADDGWLLHAVTGAVRQLLGWGAFVVFATLGVLGVRLLVRRFNLQRRLDLRTILGFELLLFALLPLTHLALRATYDDALLGRAGGIIGWALASPLRALVGPALTWLLWLLVALLALAVMRHWTLDDVIRSLVYASGRLRHWAETLATDPDDEPVVVVRPPTRRAPKPAAPAPPAADGLVPARLRLRQSSQRLPPLTLLENGSHVPITPLEIDDSRMIIEQTLHDFGLEGKVVSVRSGPSLTQFGVEPGYMRRYDANGELVREQKVRVAQIANLQKDLALALAVPRLRIEAPVPGRGIVGIEVPNPEANTVRLRDVLGSDVYHAVGKPLTVALGQGVSGTAHAVDLAKLPHVLIAGTTGSGKSVCMKSLLMSLIMHNTPETLRLVLIDPKRVEMIRFNGLPHLLGPTEVEGDRIIGVLRWLVAEMELRYELLSNAGARQITTYNRSARSQGRPTLPYIVVMIDELADLMALYSAETERTLCRLAQMARAVGIHLVVATQRPSTDVITGLIKANFPARIAFAVASQIDSRVILDTGGADQLLGNGDMLFLGPDAAVPTRIQGCFVDEDEVERVVAFWTAGVSAPAAPPPWESLLVRMKVIEDTDDEIERAIALCQENDTISTSFLQRRLRVGFPRAARIMETLYEMGLVEDPKTGGKTRRTRITTADDDPLGQYIADR